jgi:hypothetical protein
MEHYENLWIVTRKCQQKMMKEDFQLWITFEILWSNGILAPLRIMDTPLKTLKLNFRLGNADFNRGKLWKSWNRNTKISTKNDESRFSNMNNFWNPIGLWKIGPSTYYEHSLEGFKVQFFPTNTAMYHGYDWSVLPRIREIQTAYPWNASCLSLLPLPRTYHLYVPWIYRFVYTQYH